MNKQTIYKAVLTNGKHIKAKTLAKLRRFAPQIAKVWKEQKHKKDSSSICGYSGFYLDKLLQRPIKGKYRVKYMNNWIWVHDSEKHIFSKRITPRLWKRLNAQKPMTKTKAKSRLTHILEREIEEYKNGLR